MMSIGGFRAGRVCVSDLYNKSDIKEKNKLYVGFIGLEKVYDRFNREALWQVLRMYDVGVNF